MRRLQGDVIVKKVEKIPSEAKKQSTNTVAYGEATGHTHRFVGDGVTTYLHMGILYVDVPDKAKLIHEEHHEIDFDAGVYEIGRVKEYDHFREEVREVSD